MVAYRIGFVLDGGVVDKRIGSAGHRVLIVTSLRGWTFEDRRAYQLRTHRFESVSNEPMR